MSPRKGADRITADEHCDSTFTVAFDLGDLKHAFYVMNTNGGIIDERSIPNRRDDLELLLNQYPDARIGLEVGSHNPWMSRIYESMTGKRTLRRTGIFDSDKVQILQA